MVEYVTNDEEIAKNRQSYFPGIQGGPLMHIINAKLLHLNKILNLNLKNKTVVKMQKYWLKF